VTPKEKSPFFEGDDAPVYGFNFIRIDRKKRTACLPAMPRRWSIHPRTAGFGFFIDEQTRHLPDGIFGSGIRTNCQSHVFNQPTLVRQQ